VILPDDTLARYFGGFAFVALPQAKAALSGVKFQYTVRT
jgi:hypothetical protein